MCRLLEDIKKAAEKLYGGYDKLSEESRTFIETVYQNPDLTQLYAKVREDEKTNKDILIEFEDNYPDVLNGDNLTDILKAARVQPLIDTNLPVFGTSEPPEKVLTFVRHNIVKLLAPSCSMHGVFMDVFGMGILLSGQSGIGKSELGLELVTRGHGLVADDVVDFIQRAPDWVEGSAPALLANLLEVRGIGLLDIKTIFGETSVRRKMRLNLVAELKQFDQGELMERLPETELFTEVLGQPIRKMIIPVGGGRNLAVLVEAAVRSAILQLRGINTIQEFFDRQRKLMEQEDGF